MKSISYFAHNDRSRSLSTQRPAAWHAHPASNGLTHRSKNRITRSPSARASSMGDGAAPQAQSSTAPRKLTIRVALNRNAEALHDAANLAK
jgi:hypothetical protein